MVGQQVHMIERAALLFGLDITWQLSKQQHLQKPVDDDKSFHRERSVSMEWVQMVLRIQKLIHLEFSLIPFEYNSPLWCQFVSKPSYYSVAHIPMFNIF